MNSMLKLKERTNESVIYFYSADSTLWKNNEPICDGEICYNFQTDEVEILKYSTDDSEGKRAKWVIGFLGRIIFKENCPQDRFIAVG